MELVVKIMGIISWSGMLLFATAFLIERAAHRKTKKSHEGLEVTQTVMRETLFTIEKIFSENLKEANAIRDIWLRQWHLERNSFLQSRRRRLHYEIDGWGNFDPDADDHTYFLKHIDKKMPGDGRLIYWEEIKDLLKEAFAARKELLADIALDSILGENLLGGK